MVLSKGHCSLALYAWFVEAGVLREDELAEFATPGSRLQTHPEAGRLPGILVSTGSLGQGLSIANGLAIAAKIDGVRREVAVLLGDGELDEGQVWEAAATTATLGLDNVVALVDRNGFQHTGPTEKVKLKEPLAERWRAFGWHVVEARRSPAEIARALEEASNVRGRPTVILVQDGTNY